MFIRASLSFKLLMQPAHHVAVICPALCILSRRVAAALQLRGFSIIKGLKQAKGVITPRIHIFFSDCCCYNALRNQCTRRFFCRRVEPSAAAVHGISQRSLLCDIIVQSIQQKHHRFRRCEGGFDSAASPTHVRACCTCRLFPACNAVHMGE